MGKIKEFIEDHSETLLIGLMSAVVVGGVGTGIGFLIKHDIDVTAANQELYGALSEKISNDLISQDQVKINDLKDVTINLVNLQTKGTSSISNDKKGNLIVYGVVNNVEDEKDATTSKAFKLNYTLPYDYKVSYSSVDAVNDLKETLVNAPLEYSKFDDISATSLNIISSKEQLAFTKSLKKVVNKEKVSSSADLFTPVYSEVSIMQKDDKNYAVMKLEGIESEQKRESNTGAGILAGAYTWEVSDGNFGYTLLNAVVASEIFSTTSMNNWYTERLFAMEIDNANYSDSEVRRMMVDQIKDENQNLETKLTYKSYELGGSSKIDLPDNSLTQ